LSRGTTTAVHRSVLGKDKIKTGKLQRIRVAAEERNLPEGQTTGSFGPGTELNGKISVIGKKIGEHDSRTSS